jgi:hypothetical protein
LKIKKKKERSQKAALLPRRQRSLKHQLRSSRKIKVKSKRIKIRKTISLSLKSQYLK